MAKYFHQTILALLAVTLLFFFTACADTLPPPLAITAPPGSDYAFAAVLATQLPEESGWVFNLSLAADSVQALSLVDQQERTLAIVESDLLSDAYQGIDLWADRPTLRHTAVLATLYPLPCVLVVAADNPAAFISAKAGTRLSLGQDSTAITARRLLAASGLDTSQLTLSEEDLTKGMSIVRAAN
ncbi:MAG: TAXI family TRAP transporter solute-binding subunit, partial [Clostridiales bacterium]